MSSGGLVCRVLAVLVGAGLLAGCGQLSPPEWTGQVCDALAGWVDGTKAAPGVTPTDLPATQQAQVAALRAAVEGLDRTRATLAEVGESPLDGGDAALARLRASVDTLHGALSANHAELVAANPYDAIPFTIALERSGRGLISLRAGLEEARTGFDADAALRGAAQASPSCQRIGFGTPPAGSGVPGPNGSPSGTPQPAPAATPTPRPA